MSKYFLFLVFLGLIMASCVPQKKILYLQDVPKDEDSTYAFTNDRLLDYQVQPGDNLYIKINSLEEKSTTYFNEVSGSNTSSGESNLYLNSYLVNDTGYFHFPSLGYIFVKDMTTEEIQIKLEKRLTEYLVNPVVIVRLASFRITLLGEFDSPGKYDIYQSNINIFEAISMAGDMTDFAKRDKIAIIRQTSRGSKIVRVNLNDKRILESDYYFLLPNDIVYAEPVKAKQFVSSNFPYGLVFSILSTTFLLYAFIVN